MLLCLNINEHAVFLAYVFLGEIDEVLQIDVVAVRPDVVVDEQVELVFNPVLEDKRQDPRRQLQEEDDPQEHGELQRSQRQTVGEFLRQPSAHRTDASSGTYKLQEKGVLPQCSNTPCKAQDEHDPPDHHEEPDWVQPPQVCDGRDVGQNPLRTETEPVRVSAGLNICQEGQTSDSMEAHIGTEKA